MTAGKARFDLFTYLPDKLDSVRGQKILMDEFGKGAFSLMVTEGFTEKQEYELEMQMRRVEHVDSVFGYSSLTGGMLPSGFLPDSLRAAVTDGDARLIGIFFDDTASSETTVHAVEKIRAITGGQCFLSGLSAVAADVRECVEERENVFILIAVGTSVVFLMLTLDSFLLAFLILICILVSAFWNLGTNFFLGEISYLTRAASVVLQMAVTLDYAVFFWHAYRMTKQKQPNHEEAMARTVVRVFPSILGSGAATIACFASIGMLSMSIVQEIGLVMIKGVSLSVVCTILLLPCMLLATDGAIENTSHTPILPKARILSRFILRHARLLGILFVLVSGVAFYGCMHVAISHDLWPEKPGELSSVEAEEKLAQHFELGSAHMLLVDAGLEPKTIQKMASKMEELDGIRTVLGLHTILGGGVPEAFLPHSVLSAFRSEGHQLLIVPSTYAVSSDAMQVQVEEISRLLKQVDPEAVVTGEASLTWEMASRAKKDFFKAALILMFALVLVLAFVQKSVTLPIVTVAVTGFAILVTLSVPFYAGTVVPFSVPVVIFTVQLAMTIDYAILLTDCYTRERGGGKPRREAVSLAVSETAHPILAGGISFFAAAMASSLYARIDLVSMLCRMTALGTAVSVLAVLFFLPVMLIFLDRIIARSTAGMKNARRFGSAERMRLS